MVVSPREFLLVVCAGASSLHRQWLTDDRNFDLFIINYHGEEIARCGEEFHVRAKGQKWSLVHQVLSDERLLGRYRYIGIFDDDMSLTAGSVNRLFEIGRTLGVPLFQPSIDETQGYGTGWIHLLNVAGSEYRFTNLVELMVPVLTPELLIASRSAMVGNEFGWGIDCCLWPTLLAERGEKGAVIDAVVMSHTRPAQQNYNFFDASMKMRRMITRLQLEDRPSLVQISSYDHPSLSVSLPKKL